MDEKHSGHTDIMDEKMKKWFDRQKKVDDFLRNKIGVTGKEKEEFRNRTEI